MGAFTDEIVVIPSLDKTDEFQDGGAVDLMQQLLFLMETLVEGRVLFETFFGNHLDDEGVAGIFVHRLVDRPALVLVQDCIVHQVGEDLLHWLFGWLHFGKNSKKEGFL